MAYYVPEEVVDMICSYLRDPVPQRERGHDQVQLKALTSISMASRSYHRLVLPHLYSVLDFCRRESPHRRCNAIRTMLERPHYAPSVRSLHFHNGHVKCLCNRSILRYSSSKIATAVDKACLGSGFQTRLLDGLHAGCDDAGMALLLLLCPNVQTLELPAFIILGDFPLVIEIIHKGQPRHPRSVSRTPLLSHLSELAITSVGTDDGSESYGLHDIVDLLKLSNLQTLRGTGMRVFGRYPALPRLSPPISDLRPLRNVSLEYPDLDRSGLKSLLSSYPSLTSLSINAKSSRAGSSWCRAIIKGCHSVSVCDHQELLRSCGLERTKLTFLEVQYGAISESQLIDVLPCSLQTLVIPFVCGDPDQFDRKIMILMSDPKFRELTRIEIFRHVAFLENPRNVGWNDSGSKAHHIVLRKN